MRDVTWSVVSRLNKYVVLGGKILVDDMLANGEIKHKGMKLVRLVLKLPNTCQPSEFPVLTLRGHKQICAEI
jgi:hypothetical protein